MSRQHQKPFKLDGVTNNVVMLVETIKNDQCLEYQKLT